MKNANDMQQFIFDDFISNIKKFKNNEQFKKIFSLIGSAGTGKTWLTSNIISKLLELEVSVAMTTPTHKALGVVKEMLSSNNIEPEDANASTIHHFLNLKLDYGFGDDGNADNVSSKPKLKINKHNECLKHVDVLLIDESSMVSEELYNITMSTLGDRCQIVLFIGDQYQLKPVEGGENIIYNHPDITHYELTETVRQKEGSSIIYYANLIRDYIKYQQYPANVYELFTETDEIKLLVENDFLPYYFEDERKKMIGSYTNKMVNQYNTYARYIITKELEYLAVDDIVVFQKPYSNASGELIFQNGEEVKIQSTKLTQDVSTGLWYWRCKGDFRMFNVLDPSSETAYKEKVKELADAANSAKGYDKRNAWKRFFKLQTRFGFVKYAYASTLHKLQGSTYESMYFDMRDLTRFYRNDPDNVLRLIYVAITRASEKLNILK